MGITLLGFALALIVAIYGWMVIRTVQIARDKARSGEDSGERAPESENRRRSRRAFGYVFLAFGVLIALSFPLWEPLNDDYWERRFYTRGITMAVTLILGGALIVWIQRPRR